MTLFKGNGTQMVRIIPYGAISFASYEFFKSLLPPQSSPDSHWNKFVAGAGAGVITVTTTYSLDTIRTRLAFQVRNNKYSGNYVNKFKYLKYLKYTFAI